MQSEYIYVRNQKQRIFVFVIHFLWVSKWNYSYSTKVILIKEYFKY